MRSTEFKHDCPHCLTRRAGFKVVYQWQSKIQSNMANILAICGVCNLGVLVESMDVGSASHAALTQYDIDYPGSRFHIRRFWPNNISDIPEGVPDNVSRFYRQGLESLFEARWDAAGAMFRKTLDVGTKYLSPNHREMTLFRRINALVETGLLTDAMGDWSHEIRLDGNDAVHDETPETENDARSSQRFTEAFLNYSFTLPQLVESNRSNREHAS